MEVPEGIYRIVCYDGKINPEIGLSDVKGKNVKVTTQLGTGWIDLLDQIPDGKTGTNYETTSECFMSIQNGTTDVCSID